MKKLLFALPILALLAAGCNSSQQVSNQTPVAQNTNPNNTPTPIGANNSTAPVVGTVNYTNSKYNFQMSVPQNDTTQVSSPSIISDIIVFYNTPNTMDLNKEDFAIRIDQTDQTLDAKVNFETLSSPNSNPGQKTNLTIGGEPAVHFTQTLPNNGSKDWYFFIHNGYFYHISKGLNFSSEQYYGIVNSVKFTK